MTHVPKITDTIPPMQRYMLSLCIGLLFLLVGQSTFSQSLANSWINYNQQYYKFSIVKDGVYRLTYQELEKVGITSLGVDPRSFKIYAKGQEQAIFVQGEQDGVFNTSDYIELYATGNDGWYDTAVFANHQEKINQSYSLFNDTLSYFLTWDATSFSNKRIQEVSPLSTVGLTPLSFFYKTSRFEPANTYYPGKVSTTAKISGSPYSMGEGYFDDALYIPNNKVKTYKISSAYGYLQGPPSRLDVTVVGESDYEGINPDHHLKITAKSMVIDTVYEGYAVAQFSRTIPSNELDNLELSVRMEVVDNLGISTDRNALASIQLVYPHQTVMENMSSMHFMLPTTASQPTYLSFTEYAIGSNASEKIWIYDLTSRKKIPVTSTDNLVFHSVFPVTTATSLACYITREGNTQVVTNLKPVSSGGVSAGKFTNYLSAANADKNYLIVSHPDLMKPSLSYANPVDAYKNYRNSTGYKSLVVNVEELYDQFSYGINKHPMAIRNFLKATISEFHQAPEFVFLIGKGHRAHSDGTYPEYRDNAVVYQKTLIPSYGFPPSDIMYSSGIIDNLYQPAIATGRLSAKTPNEVEVYLNKVKGFETAALQSPAWKKNVLHFAGGTSASEQLKLFNFLENYRNIISDTLFGADVKTFKKTSSAPIQTNLSDSLRLLINNGVSMMTFFGHAAGIGFDQSIDDPSAYDNYNKYPFLLANSCYAGDIYNETVSSSERFVLIENKGAIAYLASIYLGIPNYLNLYSSELYKQIAYKNYGQPIGKQIKSAIKQIQKTDYLTMDVCYLMTLHGDPAIVINKIEKPDFMIGAEHIFFTPSLITSAQDSFQVHVIVENLGKAVLDSFTVELRHSLGDGKTINTYYQRLPTPLYKDTITFSIPLDKANGVGLNTMKITVDALNEVIELNEYSNNIAEHSLFIRSSDILPVYPYEYAVIPTNKVTLVASTVDYAALAQDYFFQLDTTPTFSSNLFLSTTIHGKGGVLSWAIPTLLQDSVVYYWRVSVDSTVTGYANWRMSSFQYIKDKSGWEQAHFYQFNKDTYEYVNYNMAQRDWSFSNHYNAITAQTGVYPNIDYFEEYVRVNGVTIAYGFCLHPYSGMRFIAFNPVSGEPYLSQDVDGYGAGQYFGQNNNWHCQNTPYPSFDFSSYDTYPGNVPPNFIAREEWENRMVNFIDSLPEHYMVLVSSHMNHNAQNYSEKLYTAFETIGCKEIRNIKNNTPYLCYGEKKSDMTSVANESIGQDIKKIIQLKDSLQTHWNKGYIASTLIGPAKKWGSLHWRFSSEELVSSDEVTLQVIGVKETGESDIILNSITPDSLDMNDLSAYINAAEYPYLRLKTNMKDDVAHTPAQMRRWHVLFDEIPETAIDLGAHFYLSKDTVEEGEPLLLSYATRNVSQSNMDSLLVKYWVVDASRQIKYVSSHRLGKHDAGHVMIDTLTLSTLGLSGLCQIWVEVNPDNDQIEKHHFNNIAQFYFFVKTDKTNPILEVAFDGVKIMNGDIVSGNPMIRINLHDENKFLLMTDTAHVRVFIQYPGSAEPQRVYFMTNGVETMRFVPAVSGKNTCEIIYHPLFMLDGTYQLMIQATDNTKNLSGDGAKDMFGNYDYDYKVAFKVINKSTITEVLNWPNPFTTSTRFVFTLTGNKVPEYFKIQIMTITGKIVREITQQELGTIHIGRNITDFAWDGTDRFGDRLANGVYFYRVVTELNGERVELNPTSASRYFVHGFGKMYLMR